MARVQVLVVAFWLLLGMAWAQDSQQNGEQSGTVRLPGAFAEIGWVGRFAVPGWIEFRLVASSADSYSATLETSEGKVLEGLTPISASLELPEGVGTREARVLVPLHSTRLVKITLQSATGSATARFEPNSTAFELDGNRLPPDPGLYLSGQLIFGQLEPTQALPALAGGAVLEEVPNKLQKGNWGLGAVATPHTALRLLEVLPKFVPEVLPPERHHPLLAFWSVGVFVVLLGVYSLKRHDWRFALGLALCSAVLAGVGAWASAPKAPFTEAKKILLIGANGWGTRWEIVSRFSLRPDWRLPASAMLLEQDRSIERQYTQNHTQLKHSGWQKLSYLLPPKASRIPIRLVGNKLYNQSSQPLEQIFVRGYGRQEPLAAGASRQLETKTFETLPWDDYIDLMQTLPDGAVMAKQNGVLLVALQGVSP
jgi:hypothetical protein